MSQTNTGLKTSTTTTNCPSCPTGGDGGVGVSLGDVDLSDLIINTLQLSLKDPKILWISTEATPQELLAITNFLSDNLYSVESVAFVIDAIGFLMQNPQFNFSEYENWFSSDYSDLQPDADIIDPNDITYDVPVIQQALPSFNNFLSNFPKLGTTGNYRVMPTSQVYNLVGGSLLISHQNNPTGYSNACSIRGSRALLYSGINIPVLNYSGIGQRTQKGSDNKNYILDAVSFNKYMIDQFGEATHKLEGADANDPVKVANLLKGKNGIYVIINSSHSQAGYSGHVDTIINGFCISNAYTGVSGGVKSIRIWELN